MAEERMVDALREGEIVTMRESEARSEELFILRVHEYKDAMESLPSIESRRKVTKSAPIGPVRQAPKWHSYQPDYLKNNVSRELINNFHWEIAKARKARNMTRLQLANALSVPEPAIKQLETGQLPSDDFILINKVQRYLSINIRKDGKSFDAPFAPPRAPTKADFNRPDISLSDLQKMKETQEPKKQPASSNSMSGDEIQLF